MNWKPFFWWSRSRLSFRWKLFYRGEDEYHWRTVGIRVPFGVLFIRAGFDYQSADEIHDMVWDIVTQEENRER
ncbi:hypothetical protein [Streptomyces sp. NPDC055085]